MFDADCEQETVISDGYYGMYFVTRYLLQMGHRDIVFLGRLGATSASNNRRTRRNCRRMQSACGAVAPVKHERYRFHLGQTEPSPALRKCLPPASPYRSQNSGR